MESLVLGAVVCFSRTTLDIRDNLWYNIKLRVVS